MLKATLLSILVTICFKSTSATSLSLATAPGLCSPVSSPVFKRLWSKEGRNLQIVVRKGTLLLNGAPIDARTGEQGIRKSFDIDIEIDRERLTRSEVEDRWSSRLFAGTSYSIDLGGRIISDASPSWRYSEDTLTIRSQPEGSGGTLELNSLFPYLAQYQGIDSIRGNLSDEFLLLRSEIEDRDYVYETILLTRPVKLSPLNMFHIVDTNGKLGHAVGWRVADTSQRDEFGNDYWGSEFGRVLSYGDLRTGTVFWAKPHIVWGGSLGDKILGFANSGKWFLIDRATGEETFIDVQPLTGASPQNIITIDSTLIVIKHSRSGQASVSSYLLEQL